MIKEAIQYLINEVAHGSLIELDEGTFTTKPLHHLPPPARPEALTVHTLDALIQYIQANRDEIKLEKSIVHVVSPTEVRLLGMLSDRDEGRNHYMTASAWASNQFSYGKWFELSEFVMTLQVYFQNNKELQRLLKFVGNIKDSEIRTSADDGVSQEVTIKKGIANVEPGTFENPVKLVPFRTFPEVEQPSSSFIFRMQKAKEGLPLCALFEIADDQWKLAAIKSIEEYLIESGIEGNEGGWGVKVIA